MAYTPREIDATRGLPSFQQMVEAHKSKLNIGEALQGGLNTYQQTKNFNIERALKQTEAEKNKAEAYYYQNQKGDRYVPIGAYPADQQEKLRPYIRPDGTVNATTAQAILGQQTLAQNVEHQQALVDLQKQHLAETQKQNETIDELRSQLNETGAKAQRAGELEAVSSAGRTEPSFVEKLAGKVGTALHMPAIVPDVYEQRQRALEAQNQLLRGPASAPAITPPDTGETNVPTLDGGGMAVPTKPAFPQLPVTAGPETGTPQPSIGTPVSLGGKRPTPVYTPQDYLDLKEGDLYIDATGTTKPVTVEGQKKIRDSLGL